MKDKKESEDKRNFDTATTKCMVGLKSSMTWLWSLGAIGGIGYGINEYLTVHSSDNVVDILSVSAVISGVMLVVPRIFRALDSLNLKGSSSSATRWRMYQTLLKTVILEMSLILVIVIRYYKGRDSTGKH